jgi:hypothetical protein
MKIRIVYHGLYVGRHCSQNEPWEQTIVKVRGQRYDFKNIFVETIGKN